MEIGHQNFSGTSSVPDNDELVGPVLERTNGVPHGIVSLRQAQCRVAVEEAYEGFSTNTEPFPDFYQPPIDPPTPIPTLLGLPKALRERIYTYALLYSQPISIRRHNAIVHWVDNTAQKRICRVSWHFSPPLLRACLQIQLQAAPIFFSINTFRADVADGDLTDLLDWLQGVPAAYLSCVRDLVLRIEPTCLADVAELSARAADREGMRDMAVAFTTAVVEAGFGCECIHVEMPMPKWLGEEEAVWGVGAELAMEVTDRWVNMLMDELMGLEEMIGRLEECRMTVEGM